MLTRDFFQRDALSLARALLGTILVHDSPAGECRGRIVEVEAYCGVRDRAAHSFGGRRTPRNEAMYGPAGHAYVYFIYGMHYCVNVVAADVDVPEAVLIRALEPVAGIELMKSRRATTRVPEVARLCRGPANLTRAMGIDRRHNGHDLLSGALRIEPGKPLPSGRIARAPRVGVAYAGPDAARPWRLYERGQSAVSALPGRRREASGRTVPRLSDVEERTKHEVRARTGREVHVGKD